MFAEFISLFFLSFILGAIGSVPLGLLGSYMVDKAVRGGIKRGMLIAAFGSFFDGLFCFASLFGIYLIINILWLKLGIQAVGVIFLSYVGFLTFFRKNKNDFSFLGKINFLFKGQKGLENYANDFLIVTVYYLLNPVFFAFWLNISSMLHSFPLLRESILAQLIFSFFVGFFGFLISYIFLKTILKTGKNFLVTKKAKKIIGTIYFIALIIFAFYILKSFLSFR